jgi:tetratricopeptide (TPR) repeat protein
MALSLLTAAIRAELDSDYGTAVRNYRRLAKKGSLLDRVGIFQSIARCYEKLGKFTEAATWRERAGNAYARLPTRVMRSQERTYYALVEFRSAIQDYKNTKGMRRVTNAYLKALDTCLKASKEGYSHEMLFAALLAKKLGLRKKAAGFFKDAAKQFERDGKSTLARELHEFVSGL